MDVIGNNIANSNTAGFKGSRADFEDTFSQSLVKGGSVGSGVGLGGVQTLFSQGSFASTSNPSDLAINGSGFFVVKDPVSGKEFATRDGSFMVENGYVVNERGYRLQGFSDGALGTKGDVQIDATGKPAGSTATMAGFNIQRDGTIKVKLSDNTEFTRGQVLLQNFGSPQLLTKEGGNLYSGFAAAGALPSGSQAPGSSGLGTLESSALELSNVDLSNEFANLITAQRGFQASARMITTSDELLQEVINLKR
jgi:flagellar hook protein FlgE